MLPDAYAELKNEIAALREELNQARARDLLSLTTIAGSFHDGFSGDSIDTRWNPIAVGAGAVAPALQATPPPRLLFDTGALAIGASSILNEAAMFKYVASAGISMFSIAKLASSLTNVVADVLRLSDGTANNNIMIRYNSAVGPNFFLHSVSGGVAATPVDLGVVADLVTYNTFAFTVKTGEVRARINGGPLFRITTNVPTANLGIRYEIADQTVLGSKQMELRLHFSRPEVLLF